MGSYNFFLFAKILKTPKINLGFRLLLKIWNWIFFKLIFHVNYNLEVHDV